MLQGKVIEQRPLPGLAHAFVYWGFLAFALVTINHIASAFGARFLSHDSGFGSFYLAFVAVWAVAVAISIAGLFVRRFVVRPVWLGKVAPESGFIAFLIFTLMATYLAGLWIDEESLAGQGVWWLHTMALVIFLPLIPHTKHLHLVLSPATVFLKRQGFSRIPPLAGDEDFGLDTGKDVTRIDALQAFSCVECGRCTEHCPAANTGKVLNPKEIILGLRNYLNEFGPGNEAPLLGKHISEEAAFQCTTCGACEFQCPVGIQHLPMIIGLRRGAVNTGKWEDDYGTKLFLNLERNGNAMGFATSERQKFIEKNSLPLYDGSQEYCLWLGCMGAYDPQGREIVLALVRVLRHAGVTFGVLRKEKCTGDPARRLGNDLAFTQVAEANIETLQAANIKKMVSICPHCVRTIGTDWREAGATFEIEHHSELLARLTDRLPAAAARCGARDRRVPRPLLSGPLPRHVRRAAGSDRADRVSGGSGPLARAFVLLRGGRRPDVPGRGKGQAREHRAGGGTGGDRRAGDRHGLSVLPDDVPRCAGHGDADAAEAAGHRTDRGGVAAAGTIGRLEGQSGREMVY